jgi:tripartite-type tricarboxylate transporter receptor subunit TctC
MRLAEAPSAVLGHSTMDNAMTLARRRFLGFAGAGLALASAPRAFAQSYPVRPVRIIVPVAAGGPNDVSARMVAQKLTETWGHNVLIENMPGGSENIGMGAAARSKPDGYTLLFVAGAFTANPVLYSKIPYDPIKDFAPITLLASGPLVLSVHPSFPAKTVQELIAVVRANPGKYTFASSGAATQVRLVGEQFKHKHGLDLVHVPFNGGGPAINSAVGGHTPIIVTSLSAAAAVIRGGQLRGLAVTSRQRSPAVPDVPTMAETGNPELEAGSMQGILAPAATPKPIIELWHREVARIAALPDVKERLAAMGLDPIANTPGEFSAYIKVDLAKWGKIVNDANIRIE